MRKRPRILLIGGQGQLAWELRRTLPWLGEVVVASRAPGAMSVDLLRPGDGVRVIQRVRPDWVVNAAAYTAVDRAEQEESAATQVNGTAPGDLAEATRRIGGTFVHYSTDYVFDGAGPHPYHEEAPPRPLGVYGKSKRMGEVNVVAAGGRYLILRTGWVYGCRGHNFVRTIRRLAREREELAVVADQRGAPTWARDLAEGTTRILARYGNERDVWQERAGIYHLSASGETSWHQFACRIVEHQSQHEPIAVRRVRPITTAELEAPAPRPGYSVLDNSKVRRVFGVSLPPWELAWTRARQELPAAERTGGGE